MLSAIFTIILGGASIYFFYQNNFFVGVILLVWTLSRLFGVSLQRLIRGMGELTTHSELERKCNVSMELCLNMEEILKCASVDKLFEKLKEGKIIQIEKDEWLKKLVENYKKEHQSLESWEKVKYNIKNNLLWKNEKIDFVDSVYHEIFIPYLYKDGKEREEKSFLIPEIEVGLTIRIFIVNGVIKLQVGNFSKKYSPKILRDGGLAVYQTYETITSFPLLYFSYQHKIPEAYLNLSAYATDSWRDSHSNQKSADKSKNMTTDWRQLNQEIRDYNYVCNLADEYIEDKEKWQKIVKNFNEKKDAWLKREEFKNPFATEDDNDSYDDRFDDNSIHYRNKYLSIFVANYNDYKEKREKYVYTDYYEECP